MALPQPQPPAGGSWRGGGGSRCPRRTPSPRAGSRAGPVLAEMIRCPSRPRWQRAPPTSPHPRTLTGADPPPVPRPPHLKQRPLCPRSPCWDGPGLRRQRSQSPCEGPSGDGQRGVRQSWPHRPRPLLQPPWATLTLLSVTVCCSQISISSMVGTRQREPGEVTAAAGRRGSPCPAAGGADRLRLLFAAAGPFLNPTSGCNEEQKQS